MRRNRAATLEALALAPHPSNHYTHTFLPSFPDGQEGKWDPPSVAERPGKCWLFLPPCVLGQGGQYSLNHTFVSFFFCLSFVITPTSPLVYIHICTDY